MWLLPAVMPGLGTAAVRNQRGSKGDTNTVAAEGKVGNPGQEPAVHFSGLRASALLPSIGGEREQYVQV